MDTQFSNPNIKSFLSNSFVKLMFVFLLQLPVATYAQSDNSEFKFGRTTGQQAEIFLQNKPEGPNAVPVPRFTLQTTNDKFWLTIGGFIQPIMGMDIGNTLDGCMYFSPSNISNVPAVKGQKADFFINPLNSSVDFQVIGFPHTCNQLVGYVKFDFTAGTNDKYAGLSSAYIKYRGFLAGYNYSLFTDVRSLPATISWSGVTGNNWSKAYQVSYNSPSFSGFGFGVSVAQPSFHEGSLKYEGKDYPDFDGDEVIGKATQPIPDIPFYLQYQWKKAGHIRLSGLVRNFNYVDKVKDRVRNTTGLGVQLSTSLKLADPLTFYGQCIYGKGIANYISGMQYLPVSYLPSDSEPGKIKATEMMGWLAALKCYVTPDIYLNAAFGQSRIFGVNDKYWDKYHYGLDSRFSIFYNITPYIRTAVEYLWAKQVQFDHQSASVNRIQAMVMFSL